MEDLEAELSVLLTHAARKRAQVERARGFSRGDRSETSDQRSARIADMKARMPCSACKSHGKTVYGHWHGDEACPYYGEKGNAGSKGRDNATRENATARSKPVLAVTEEELSDSDESFGVNMAIYDAQVDNYPEKELADPYESFGVNMAIDDAQVFSAFAPAEDSDRRIALGDTCCARTVVGDKWAKRHMRSLLRRDIPVYLVDEKRPSRFGGGPRVYSEYAMIFPIFFEETKQQVVVRASVVDQRVPLLLSRGVMEKLGAILDLGRQKMDFKRLDVTIPLRRTAGGMCGFDIDHHGASFTGELPWQQFVETEEELAVLLVPEAADRSRTAGSGNVSDLLDHPEPRENSPE